MNLDTEKQLFNNGYNYIAGVDEAGRGPLAGPVVAACVIVGKDFEIDEDCEIVKVADSKKLSAKKREELFKLIKEKVKAVEISVVGPEAIDKINILKASLLAMKKSVEKCSVKTDFVLVDGSFKIPDLNIEQKAIPQGDAKVFTIAAASIIAKVSRDYLMTEYDKKYPEYEFARHKGYGTKIHMEKLKEYGPSPIHRQSFAPVRRALEEKDKKQKV